MQLMQKIMGGGSPAADDDSSSVGGGAAAGANATSSTSTASALEAPPAKLTIIYSPMMHASSMEAVVKALKLGGVDYAEELLTHPKSAEWQAKKELLWPGMEFPVLVTVAATTTTTASDVDVSDAVAGAAGRGGPVMISQQLTMLLHVSRVSDDLASTFNQHVENAVFKIDETWGYLLASRGIQYIPESFAHPCFFKGTEEHKQGYTGMRWKWTHENLKKLLDAFEAQMARLGGTPYLCGAAPSVADCLFVTRLQRLPKDYAPLNAAECYETSEAIKAYMDRLQANPIFQTQIGS